MIDRHPDPRDGADDVTSHNVAAAIPKIAAVIVILAVITVILIGLFDGVRS